LIVIASFLSWLSETVDVAWPLVAVVGICAILFCVFEANKKDEAEDGRRYWRNTAIIWLAAFFLLWLRHRRIL
jgi:hypothetical protein